jgi:hypothetical protein
MTAPELSMAKKRTCGFHFSRSFMLRVDEMQQAATVQDMETDFASAKARFGKCPCILYEKTGSIYLEK